MVSIYYAVSVECPLNSVHISSGVLIDFRYQFVDSPVKSSISFPPYVLIYPHPRFRQKENKAKANRALIALLLVGFVVTQIFTYQNIVFDLILVKSELVVPFQGSFSAQEVAANSQPSIISTGILQVWSGILAVSSTLWLLIIVSDFYCTRPTYIIIIYAGVNCWHSYCLESLGDLDGEQGYQMDSDGSFAVRHRWVSSFPLNVTAYVSFPLIGYMLAVAISDGVVDTEVDIQASTYNDITLDWVSVVLNLAVNVVATLLIAYRAWWVLDLCWIPYTASTFPMITFSCMWFRKHHNSVHAISHSKRTQVEVILLLFVESGAIFGVIQVCHLLKDVFWVDCSLYTKILMIVFTALDVHAITLSPIDNASFLIYGLYIYIAVSEAFTITSIFEVLTDWYFFSLLLEDTGYQSSRYDYPCTNRKHLWA